MRIQKYPKNPDGSPMTTLAALVPTGGGVFVDRLIDAPRGPDNAQLPTIALLLVDSNGNPVSAVTTIGAFTTASTLNLGAEKVVTSCYRVPTPPAVATGGAVYVKDSLVNGAFAAAHPGWSFVDAIGNGYRISEEQKLTFEMFGAYGDGATDDYPQWLIAKDFIQTYATIRGNSYFKSVPALNFSRASYRLSHYIDLTDGVYVLQGAGPTAVDRGGNTMFFPDPGTSGIVCQSWDTTGISGTTTNTPKGSAGSRITDITIYGQGGTVGNLNEIGVLLKAPVFLERVNVYNMGGHGFWVAADVTHAGNANCGKMRDCVALYNGLSGFRFEGGDSNAWEVYGPNASFNGQWGVHELSFLGSHFYGYHTAGNGTLTAGPSWALPATRKTAQVTYNGHYYRVIPGTEATAGANAPSGAATSNAWWMYVGDGAANAIYPTWTNGIATTQGGAFYVTGASNKAIVTGGYMESDQAQGYCDAQRAVIIAGGFSAWNQPAGLGNILGAMDGRLVVPMFMTGGVAGAGTELNPTQIQLSASCYFERTGAETFDLRGPLGASLSMQRYASGAAQPYAMGFPKGINVTVPVYADNAAATAGGLPVGGAYRTATGVAMYRY